METGLAGHEVLWPREKRVVLPPILLELGVCYVCS